MDYFSEFWCILNFCCRCNCCGFRRYETASLTLGLCAFFLSILYTLIGVFALVRFWMFSHVSYTIFTITMITVGILIMISSIIIFFSNKKVRWKMDWETVLSQFSSTILGTHTNSNYPFRNSDCNFLEFYESVRLVSR